MVIWKQTWSRTAPTSLQVMWSSSSSLATVSCEVGLSFCKSYRLWIAAERGLACLCSSLSLGILTWMWGSTLCLLTCRSLQMILRRSLKSSKVLGPTVPCSEQQKTIQVEATTARPEVMLADRRKWWHNMQNTHTWTETKPPCAYCKVLNIIVIPGKLRKMNEGQQKIKAVNF